MSRSRRPAASPSSFWKRLFLWGVPAFLALFAIAFICAKMAINTYLHSDSFRQFVARKAGVTLGAECDLAPLQFDSGSVYTDGFKARGGPEAPFSSLSLDQLRAEISLRRFFEHIWEVEHVETQRVEIHFDGSRVTLPDADFAPQPASTESPGKPGWMPNRVEVGSASVRDANLIWKGG
jgi:hypothetical protein